MYQNFQKFIEKGPENYFQTLKKLDILNELSEFYYDNPLEHLFKRYDKFGNFTEIMFTQYSLYGKQFDEEPLRSFKEICDLTFNNEPYSLEITFIFRDAEGQVMGSYSVNNESGESEFTPKAEQFLWDNYVCSGDFLKVIFKGYYVKEYFDSGLKFHPEMKATMLNKILENANHKEKRRWLCGIDGYFFIEPETLDKIMEHNLIAPKEYYYQFD